MIFLKRLNKLHRQWASAFSAILLLSSVPNTAKADPAPEIFYGATIEGAQLDASDIGETSMLRFRIVNDGAEPLILLGATSDDFGRSKILAYTSHATPVDLESVAVPIEEELGLDSFHLTIELSELKTKFRAGQIITLNLAFVRGEIPIQAHVH